jgi:hypothetical protein
MAQRRFHYDAAFEHYLRANAIPYVAVDEAKRALSAARGPRDGGRSETHALKSFDFVVYSEVGPNLLVDVKGRKHTGRTGRSMQNWVTVDDAEHLAQWEKLFGHGFVGAFAFLFWCEAQPPDALFAEIFEHGNRWYAVQGILLADYRAHMRKRSERWDTVSIPAEAFARCARPLHEMLSPASRRV